MIRRSALAVVVCVVLAGCAPSGSPQASSSGSASPAPAASVVALGDSVPRGTNCDCTPYPELTATDLSAAADRAVTATNDSVAGATSDDVLRQVTSDQGVIAHVRGADAVEIEVGANDVAHSSSCDTSLPCYTPRLPHLTANLEAVVARVHELTAGRRVLVVLLDYWSVWLGGAYAAEQGEAYVATVEALTGDVNAAIMSVAAGSASAYVDLRAAFKGPSFSYDETHYLSDDGDHPNAAGHRQIADAAVSEITTTVPAVSPTTAATARSDHILGRKDDLGLPLEIVGRRSADRA